VVEDDDVTREAIRDLLEVQNYRVLMASNGAEAIKIYEGQAESISLLISDIVMPEVGGVDLFNLLRSRYPEVKFLFITGHPLLEENQAILVDGGISWLEKPFSVPDFSQAVKALLEER
jgi:CheY-like chemotaxis protein